MTTFTKDKLYAPLSVHSRRGRGGNYDYVKAQSVYDRMNEVFGINWGAEVVNTKEVNGKVIVQARVTAVDPETKRSNYQDGFGGAVDDASSEAGNPYKAAYSKAVKDACKKWGVGLFLDEEGESIDSIPFSQTGTATVAPPNPPPVVPPVPEMPSINPPVSETAGFAQSPTVAPTSVGTQSGGLEMPASVSMGSAPITTSPPVSVSPPSASTNMPPSKPPQVKLNEEMPMSNNATVRAGQPDTISDVQKAALNSILSIEGVDYNTLVKEAFEVNGLDGTIIPTIDDLTYKQAVYVVKYGNDKFRRH